VSINCRNIDVLIYKLGITEEHKYRYGLLDAFRAHGRAYMRASQTLTEKSINEKLKKNSIFLYEILLLS
jgi:hypothetical protein